MADKKTQRPLVKDLVTITREYSLALCQDQVYSLIASLIQTHRLDMESEELGFLGFALDSYRSKFMFTYRWPVKNIMCRQFFYIESKNNKIYGRSIIKQGYNSKWRLLSQEKEQMNKGD